MRGPGVLVFFVAALASTAVIAACSLAVDTTGLSGATAVAESGTGDGATTDAGASDATPTDGAQPDAGFSCDGGTRLTSFDRFTKEGNVVVAGSTVTATGSTNAKNEQFSALVLMEVQPLPSRMFLSYDLSLTASQSVYFEPGCGVYLEDTNGQTVLRQTFAANGTGFSQYVNVTLPDGGTDNRNTGFADLPSGETTRHVELLLTTSGSDVSVDVTLDGIPRSDKASYTAAPQTLKFRCGIPYGNQQVPGSFTTTVAIRNVVISLCP